LDAATRGLRTGIVESLDWAQGTSSRSSKLVHGGLRYLYNLDFKLVAEALHERGLLLDVIAPHLVTAQPFLWPLRTPVIERAYSAVGVGLYDLLAFAGAGKRTVPFQKHLSRAGAKAAFPDVRDDSLVGAIEFYDARVDDARLVVTLVRTAARFGALAASRTTVTDFIKDAAGRVSGAVVTDNETGEEHRIRARHVINATGVWTEETQAMAGGGGGLRVLASKGIHLVVPKDRIKGSTGMFLRTEKSVLFIIPWPRYWVIGTTDTAWHEDRRLPVATAADIDYVLDHANAVLSSRLTRDDVVATFAGLRPLLQPGTLDESSSTKVSREHTVTQAAEGLTVIAGGKLTTYRVMARDAVDFALGGQAARLPSVTDRTPLIGADGLEATRRSASRIAARYGWEPERVEHLLSRYGSAVDELLSAIDADPELGKPLASEPAYLRAEIAHAVTHEGALHLEDILRHRVRLVYEAADRGLGALAEIAGIVTPLLSWDQATADREQEAYRSAVATQLQAEQEPSDAAAAAHLTR
ncbi:MAG: glycerol-3-phosphate dehydrogenase/oxidase, partial [Propionibacteriaceae bacterium]|nr:glycerol-3-phosphate dehydrogenase/oxidase [Propionibacteriaceae bacterium]